MRLGEDRIMQDLKAMGKAEHLSYVEWKAFGREIHLVIVGRIDWTRQVWLLLAGWEEGCWTGVEVGRMWEQLCSGVFWKLSLQNCPGGRYRKGRIKNRFGVKQEGGSTSWVGRTGDSHVIREGTQRTFFLLFQKYDLKRTAVPFMASCKCATAPHPPE